MQLRIDTDYAMITLIQCDIAHEELVFTVVTQCIMCMPWTRSAGGCALEKVSRALNGPHRLATTLITIAATFT